ncbi:cytosine permease [Bacillus sp. 1P06AnD]|uniref:cytosine permease n=1 Tax=Bacillus sp. 1P06AnD TaxID=3132208 RepID=UPI0039A24CD9
MQLQDKDYSFSPVPKGQRNSFIKMLAVMLGFTFFSASMWAGGSLGEGMTFTHLIGVILIGNVILGAFTGSLSYIAAKTGLSTHLLAQYSFGKKGSYISSFMLCATQVGWFGVGVGMFAYPVHKVTGIPTLALVIVFGILMTVTAYFGMKALTILSMVAVPAIAVLGSMSATTAVQDMGGIDALMAYAPGSSLTLAAALTITVGSFISGGTLTPDFARFAKSGKHAVITTVIAFFLGNTLMFLFGAIGTIATGHNDISDVMFSQGLMLPAILVLGLNIWTTNDNALYASGLGFATMFKKPKVVMVMINGAIGTLLATWLYNNFVSWLTFLGSTLPAVGAIIIVDFFFIKKRKYVEYEKAEIKNLHIPAVIAWAAGVIAGLTLPGIAPVNTLLVTGIAYFAAVKVMKTNAVSTKKEEEIYELEKVG